MTLGVLIAAFAAFAVAALLSGLVAHAGLLDAPTLARKAHRAPTPTGGGLAIGAGLAAGLALATLPSFNLWAEAGGPMAVERVALSAIAAFVAMAIGLRDDLRPLGPITKTGALLALSFFLAILVARAERLPIAEGVALEFGPTFGVIGSALFVFTLINATNFMDGANGLAMGSTALSLLGLAVISFVAGAPHAALLALCGAAALAGFLVWNFPAGKLFAGDAGSLSAGTLAASASLLAVQDGGVSPIVPAILFFPTLADVLLTLAWRVGKRRANLMNGHREHLFQIGLRAGLSHVRVTLVYWALTAHCVLIAIVAAQASNISFAVAGQAGALAPLTLAAAILAACAPIAALVVLAFVSLRVSRRVRKFAAARGLDQE